MRLGLALLLHCKEWIEEERHGPDEKLTISSVKSVKSGFIGCS